MSDRAPGGDGSPWEWHAELESGVSVATGAAWRGHRVSYRPRGTRRWSSFLLDTNDGSVPTEAGVLLAIERHAGYTQTKGQ